MAFLEFVSADPKVDDSCCHLLRSTQKAASCPYVGEDLPQTDSDSEPENVEAITPEEVWKKGEQAVLNCLQAVDMNRLIIEAIQEPIRSETVKTAHASQFSSSFAAYTQGKAYRSSRLAGICRFQTVPCSFQGDQNMLLLGTIACEINLSEMTEKSRKKEQTKSVCFDRMTRLKRHYANNGLVPIESSSGGYRAKGLKAQQFIPVSVFDIQHSLRVPKNLCNARTKQKQAKCHGIAAQWPFASHSQKTINVLPMQKLLASIYANGNDCLGLSGKQVMQNMAPFQGKPSAIKEKAATWKVDDFFHRQQPSGVALQTTRDGGCLFNAVSLSLTGSERSAAELSTDSTGTLCTWNTTTPSTLKVVGDICLTFNEARDACIYPNGFYSAYTIQALALVIGIPIRAIYPTMPESHHEREKEVVMWTRMRAPAAGHNRMANHFIPFVPDVIRSWSSLLATSTPMRERLQNSFIKMNFSSTRSTTDTASEIGRTTVADEDVNDGQGLPTEDGRLPVFESLFFMSGEGKCMMPVPEHFDDTHMRMPKEVLCDIVKIFSYYSSDKSLIAKEYVVTLGQGDTKTPLFLSPSTATVCQTARV
ncbi:hypothetical protein CAPTEDRAFT_188091 [Capitella teleta]|uniref:OTU domain-containing protein n=1 Tax=Capitella teleta TaxID=283909 RepID=R7UEG2_CAPTE|nr:hypothetical protein CAPTEDRAFT_188091 [Capitella teleta]|eukprot:ELU04924.1 hypothetical protein CAPTEDRAFT_188091 [Capitella teleta]